MAQKLSQLYDVDNRYREAKGVADNESGKQFLQEFIARDKRIGNSHMMVPGHDKRLGFGGACLPKDTNAILKAAGGALTNLDNEELTYGLTCFEHGGIIVATNNKNTHGSICLEIKKIIEENGIYPL